jgi:Outer membrane cobalamin receptor protein
LAKGIDITTSKNISGYDIGFGYTYAISRVNNASTQAKKRPKNIANLSIKKNYGKLNSKAQLISKSSSSISNGEKVGGYTLWNLSSTYDINNDTSLSLNIDNATDKDYQISGGDDYRYNQSGRTIELGLSYNF